MRSQLDSLPQTLALTLSPPPSSISGEMYLCLDGVYTGITSVQQTLQTSVTEFRRVKEQYTQQQTQLLSLVNMLLKDSAVSLSDKLFTESLNKAKDLQEENEKLTSQLNEVTATLAKEKERSAVSVNTAERRYESLRNEMRECLRKEQEYEDQLEGLRNDKHKLEAIIRDYEESGDTNTLREEIKRKTNEIESLTFQLAAFKSENDELMTERLTYKKELEGIDGLKSQLSECLKERDAMKAAYETVVCQQSDLETQLKQQGVQLKNAQDDLNFAQLCVGNLQASLAVYTAGSNSTSTNSRIENESSINKSEQTAITSTSSETKESEVTETPHQSPESTESADLQSEHPCSSCKQQQKELADLRTRIEVMDNELWKLRSLTRDAQQLAKQESEKSALEQRQLRQLLITYLTSTRGGAALRTLMEKLV